MMIDLGLGDAVKKMCEDELRGKHSSAVLEGIQDPNTSFTAYVQKTTLLLKMQRLKDMQEEIRVAARAENTAFSQLVWSYFMELAGCRLIVQDLNELEKRT